MRTVVAQCARVHSARGPPSSRPHSVWLFAMMYVRSVRTFVAFQAHPAPPAHASPLVHALPSSQGRVFGVDLQPVSGSQLSVVHALPSSQLASVPPHVPSLQINDD